jgi:hypothetical protein
MSAVPTPLQLPIAQFAVWAREHGVRLPYPLDISDVPGARQHQPAPASPHLDRVAQVAAAPRVAVFWLRIDPATGTSECAVAVADDALGVLVRMSATQIEIRPVPAAELVISLGSTLPAFAPLAFETATVSEERWNEILAVAAQPGAGAALEATELPARLTRAIVTPARSIGTLGALTWTSGASQLGALLASWFEYGGGAVLARLEAARSSGGQRTVALEPYSPAAAGRALASMVTQALRAAHRSS